jgi:hypothetical protein
MMSGYPNGMDAMQNNNRPYLMEPFGHARLSAVFSFVLEGHLDQQLRRRCNLLTSQLSSAIDPANLPRPGSSMRSLRYEPA